jgi:hypothetical protein
VTAPPATRTFFNTLLAAWNPFHKPGGRLGWQLMR